MRTECNLDVGFFFFEFFELPGGHVCIFFLKLDRASIMSFDFVSREFKSEINLLKIDQDYLDHV